jgi:hypothetical protein
LCCRAADADDLPVIQMHDAVGELEDAAVLARS